MRRPLEPAAGTELTEGLGVLADDEHADDTYRRLAAPVRRAAGHASPDVREVADDLAEVTGRPAEPPAG
ncbi:hypothetical protein ABT404_50805 [Streptomyces hyaluromycini]|uniref:Uncharacterized protein n=1 Tax=Streptomyces hyaluromycini TaxID=1377993 RepID=A0ABV1XF47_9ACTN